MDLLAAGHRERCRLLDAETERVASWLRSLAPSALDGPAVGEWTIREVIAHLVVVANFYAGNIERGVAGDCAAPPGRPAAGSMSGAKAAAGVLAGAAAVAASTVDDPIGAFERSAARLSAQLAALTDAQLDLPGYHPGGLLPVNRFMLLRAKEFCVHEWDMRAPTDPGACISELGVASVLHIIDENIASGSLRWAYGSDSRVVDPLRVAVTLDGPVSWQARLTVTADSIELDSPAPAGTPVAVDATITGRAESFVRFVYGRLDPTRAGAEGLLRFDPLSLADRMAGWFTGI